MSTLSIVPRVASSAGGVLLAAGVQGVSSLRRARKPLHPVGAIGTGRVFRRGSEEKTGVDWIDEPGADDVVVRLSRAIGLPRNLPDVHGLALRVYGDAGAGDILFATTGLGRVTRFVLTMSRKPRDRPLTTLLPYETESGPVLLGARAVGGDTYELSWARPAGDFHAFGVLRLSTRLSDAADISFDPVRHQIAGLRPYPAVRRLREPSYLRARRSRMKWSTASTAGTDPAACG